MNEQIMTYKAVVAYLQLYKQTAYRLVADKTLTGIKVRGSWRFKNIELEAWIEIKKG